MCTFVRQSCRQRPCSCCTSVSCLLAQLWENNNNPLCEGALPFAAAIPAQRALSVNRSLVLRVGLLAAFLTDLDPRRAYHRVPKSAMYYKPEICRKAQKEGWSREGRAHSRDGEKEREVTAEFAECHPASYHGKIGMSECHFSQHLRLTKTLSLFHA